jgi:hypothetical protein
VNFVQRVQKYNKIKYKDKITNLEMNPITVKFMILIQQKKRIPPDTNFQILEDK